MINQNQIITTQTNGKNGWNLEMQIDNNEFVIFITNINYPLLLSSIFKLKIEMEIKFNNNEWALAKTMRIYLYDGNNSWRSSFKTGINTRAIQNYVKLGTKRMKLHINTKIIKIWDKNGNEIKGNETGFYDNKNDGKCIATFYEGNVEM